MPSHDSARDVLAPPPAPAGSSHLKSSLGRTAAKCRTPTTVFPDDLGSVNVIATDLSAGSEPAELGTVLVTSGSGPGVRNQAGADPGRDCRIASGPRSRTSRRFSQRVSEH